MTLIPKPARSIKACDVEVTFVRPAGGDRGGPPLRVYARDANEALRLARTEMRDRGYDRHDGPIHYRARRAPDED
jgi:hypothetical protein